MPTGQPTFKGRWRVVALIMILWVLVASSWSYLLVVEAFEGFSRNTLHDDAEFLAFLMQREPPASDPPERLLEAPLFDLSLAYAMVWTEDGHVVLHTDKRLQNTFLDARQWPALEPDQEERLSTFKTRLDPIRARFYVNAGEPEWVTELTVPLKRLQTTSSPATSGTRQRQFLSIAQSRNALAARFRPTLHLLLLWSLAAIALGGTLLMLLLLIAFRRLDRSRREIEQTARARTSLLTERGMLASVLAHEVRSPLTALRFNLHALRSLLAASAAPPESADSGGNGGADKRLELTDRCEREIRRLDGMLTDFLQRTQVVTPAEPAAVNIIIREAVEFLTPALERNHIRISLHLDPSDPRVHVHPDELRQVILNLSANAMEAMPAPKGGTLAISTLAPPPPPEQTAPHAFPVEASDALPPSAAPPTPGTITLLFRDSGIGIPPDRLERIFEPFFSTKPNGSGLGLTLVRRVISGAGGTIFVESKPAEGTTFRILLPAV